MPATSMLSLVAPVAGASGQLSQKIIEEFPRDPASVVVLVLLLGAVAVVVWFGRSPDPPK